MRLLFCCFAFFCSCITLRVYGQTCDALFSKVVYQQTFRANAFENNRGNISNTTVNFKSNPYTQSTETNFEKNKFWITNDASLLSNLLIDGDDHSQDASQSNQKGNFLIFNASDENGTFLDVEIITGICSEKDYRFSIWASNALKKNTQNSVTGIQLQVFNAENQNLITESSTLEISKNNKNLAWNPYTVDFKIPANCSKIRLVILNKSKTTQSFLAFDDLQLLACDYKHSNIQSEKTDYCVGETIELKAPNLTLTNTTYQWQHQVNNTWVDIPNANQSSLSIPNVNLETPTLYRLKFAVSATQINSDCAWISENFIVKIAKPEVSLGDDVTVCKSYTLKANSKDALNYKWYKNNQILPLNSAEINVSESGAYKVEITNSLGCIAKDNVQITILPSPTLETPTEIHFCEGNKATAAPIVPNTQNLVLEWFKDNIKVHEGTVFITEIEGNYELKATNNLGCSKIFPFKIIKESPPTIKTEQTYYDVCSNTSQALIVTSDKANRFEWFKNNVKIADAEASTYMANEKGTYTVFGYSLYGCKSEGIQFTINSLPIPSNTIRVKNQVASSTDVYEICEGDNLQAEAVSNARNIEWYKEGDTIPISTTSDIIVRKAGTYTAVAHSDIGCSTPKSIQVIIHKLPKVTIEGEKEFCEGNSTRIKASLDTPNPNVTYRWYRLVGDTYQVMNETAPEISIKNAGTYKVTTINDKGCTSEEIFNVKSNPRPHANFSQNNVILYDKSDVNFKELVQFPNNKDELIYLWEFGDGATSNEPNPTHNYPPNRPGETRNYAVKLTVISPKGCRHSTTNNIMIHNSERPIGRFNYELPPCGGQAVRFFDNSIPAKNGGKVVGWLWDFGDGGTSTEQNPVHSFRTDGEHIITLRTTDEINGISPITSLSTIKIFLNPTPKANFVNMPNTCLNQALVVRNTSTINFGYISKWIWDFGDGTTIVRSNGSSVSHFYNTPGEKTVTLRVESPQVCFSTIQKKVIIDPLPEVDFKIPDTVCMNEVFTIDSIQNDNTVKWIWDFGDGSPNIEQTNDQVFTHKYTRAGKKTISLRAFNNLGCFNLIEKTIEVSVIPISNFKVSKQVICLGETIHIDEIAHNDIISWAWESSEGNITNKNEQPFGYTFKTIGTHFIKLTVINTIGCPDTFEIPITVTAIPQAKFSVEDKFWMVNEPVLMSDESMVEDDNWDLISYNWNMGNGSVIFGKQSPAFAFQKSGDYTVTLLNQNRQGCGTTFQQSFTVYDYPKANFTPQELNVCANETLIVTDQSFIGNNTATRLEWYFDYKEGAEPNIIETNPTLGNVYQHKLNYQIDSPIQIVIRLAVYSKTGHKSIQEKTITIHPLPKIILNKIPDLCYLNGVYQITEAKEVLGLKGKFLFQGKGISDEGLINPIRMGLGKHKITFTFVSEYGCVTTANQIVTILPSPIINIPTDIEIFEHIPYTIHPKVSGNIVSVQWLPTEGVSDPFIINPTMQLDHDQTYQLTVVNEVGCQVTVPVVINVFKEINAPSAFSPNGDGINDVWNIPNLQKYGQRTLLQIFNRQGQLLYEKHGYNTPWDGKSNGLLLPVGTYFYRITKFMGNKELTGSVTIIR